MKDILIKHRQTWNDRDFIISFVYGFIILLSSLIINYYAGHFATERAGNGLNDLLLDNLPTLNVGFLYSQGIIFFYIIAILVILSIPQKIPFALKCIGLLVLTRSFFIILTHLGPATGQIAIEPNRIMDKFTFGGDYFFSGHTAVPFLLSQIFWEYRRLRIFFLVSSVFFGAVVILGHLHYSIDVFAAYFITYTVYILAEKLFYKDKAICNSITS